MLLVIGTVVGRPSLSSLAPSVPPSFPSLPSILPIQVLHFRTESDARVRMAEQRCAGLTLTPTLTPTLNPTLTPTLTLIGCAGALQAKDEAAAEAQRRATATLQGLFEERDELQRRLLNLES